MEGIALPVVVNEYVWLATTEEPALAVIVKPTDPAAASVPERSPEGPKVRPEGRFPV